MGDAPTPTPLPVPVPLPLVPLRCFAGETPTVDLGFLGLVLIDAVEYAGGAAAWVPGGVRWSVAEGVVDGGRRDRRICRSSSAKCTLVRVRVQSRPEPNRTEPDRW